MSALPSGTRLRSNNGYDMTVGGGMGRVKKVSILLLHCKYETDYVDLLLPSWKISQNTDSGLPGPPISHNATKS